MQGRTPPLGGATLPRLTPAPALQPDASFLSKPTNLLCAHADSHPEEIQLLWVSCEWEGMREPLPTAGPAFQRPLSPNQGCLHPLPLE